MRKNFSKIGLLRDQTTGAFIHRLQNRIDTPITDKKIPNQIQDITEIGKANRQNIEWAVKRLLILAGLRKSFQNAAYEAIHSLTPHWKISEKSLLKITQKTMEEYHINGNGHVTIYPNTPLSKIKKPIIETKPNRYVRSLETWPPTYEYLDTK